MTANLNEANQPVKLADTHCHLDLNNFENDRNKVVERAKLAGIYRILIPGTDLASSRKVSFRDIPSAELPRVENIIAPADRFDWDVPCLFPKQDPSRHKSRPSADSVEVC